MKLQLIKYHDLKNYWRPTIILFMLLYLTSSYMMVYNKYDSIISITLLGCIITLCLNFKSVGYKNSIPLMLLLLVLQGFTTIINSEDIYVFFLVSIQLSIACIFVTLFNWETFKKSYILLMTTLSASSLLLFAANILFPFLRNINVVSYSLIGEPVSNQIIYVSRDLFRNQSIFWEPGAFQSFIILALILQYSQKIKNIYIEVVLIATLLSTFSTTGYIALFLTLVWYYLIEIKGASNKVKIIILAGAIFSTLVYFKGDLLFDTDNNSAFGKLIYAYENGFERNEQLTSAGIRYYALVKPLGVFVDNPIFGCGFDKLKDILYNYTEGMNTCTFVNYFAMYGFFYGIMCIWGYKKFADLNSEYKKGRFLIFIILFVITFSEEYVRNSFFYIIILYGYTVPQFENMQQMLKWKR